MVDKLCGFTPAGHTMKYKFVHQLPLVVETIRNAKQEDGRGHLGNGESNGTYLSSTIASDTTYSLGNYRNLLSETFYRGGGRLEELFLSSSHAKFYTAINTVLVAPCIVGKSNMFRRSHLNYLTANDSQRPVGVDYFSENICEDHLIGDLLWKNQVPEEKAGETWGKHAMVFGDLVIQPMAGMSITDYIARRARWLRVRKFTVTLATLVEPGTECLLCSLYGAFGVSTLPWLRDGFGIPPTWTAFCLFFLTSVTLWAFVDWTMYLRLHSAASVEVDDNTPAFARPPEGRSRRPVKEWVCAWLGRELLAFPIWAWAVFGGTTVVWRGKKLWVGMDMKVHEISQAKDWKDRRD